MEPSDYWGKTGFNAGCLCRFCEDELLAINYQHVLREELTDRGSWHSKNVWFSMRFNWLRFRFALLVQQPHSDDS